MPEQNRSEHGAALQRQIATLRSDAEQARQTREEIEPEGGLDLQVEFASFPGIELAFERLAPEGSGIELLNVRHEDGTTFATVFVPDGKLDRFEKRIQDYLDHKTDRNGRPRDNRPLIDAIRQIRTASLKALWTDDASAFPASGEEAFWWEVWLPVRGDRNAIVDRFGHLAERLEMRVASGRIEFPERTIVLVYTSAARMQESIVTLNMIAELRRAKETAEFFDSLLPAEQSAWVDEALQRTGFVSTDADAPYVCLLDTGTSRGHPMIEPALALSDLHTVEPAWGVDDSSGHGTAMAGLALFGDVTDLLASNLPLDVEHRLESVKLIPENGANTDDAQHHGYLTIQGVAAPEIAAPYRRRIFGMTVTARDNRDRGKPSSWSSALDRLVSDADGQGETPRLIVVAAGNVDDLAALNEYPASNATDGIHDPGQAWNALTVGAATNLTRITESGADDMEPIAPRGGLSPFSTTSVTWEKAQWPLKPDVVMEGGNAARNNLGAVSMPSLSLLTTHHRVPERLLTTANATSAATALAARMAAQLQVAYPDSWPETIRALMVHSAEWTDSMRHMFLSGDRATKREYWNLVKHCGFGVPNLDRALWSATDSLTMLAEQRIHPFMRGSGDPVLRDMVLHRLPWPTDELAALGEVQVEMRVTLSYFIEPNPSARGVRSRYRYESHGLRFEVKRAHESERDFRTRINAAARDEEVGTSAGGKDTNWLLGKQNRHRGSLHSDTWIGSAADLAGRGMLAVYPSAGWWKTRKKQERYDSSARYALLISIRAPDVDVDLYAPVANQIAAATAIET